MNETPAISYLWHAPAMRGPVPMPSQHAVRAAPPCVQQPEAPPCVQQPEAPPLPRRLARLAAAIGAPPDRRERLVRLVRVGDSLPRPSAALVAADGTRVSGCTSLVDVLARLGADGTLQPEGAADSRLARGLVALLVRGLRGEPPEALALLDGAAISEAAGLAGALSLSRINGLGAMLRLMREQAAAAVARRPLSVARPLGLPGPSTPALALPSDAELLAARRGSWQAAGEEVAVLLSGGVDSSVALRLLHDAGVRTRAFYLRIWLEDEDSHVARGECPWEEDWSYCSAVCQQVRLGRIHPPQLRWSPVTRRGDDGPHMAVLMAVLVVAKPRPLTSR
jgi:sulfur transfer protein SufE